MPGPNQPRSRRTDPTGEPTTEATEGSSVERLQRTLARAGFGSRRAAERLIEEGRVRVDGRVAELGDRVDPSTAVITVNGVPVAANPDLRYLALHKPAGVMSTLADPHAERSLAELMPSGPRVFPVGRLDRDSEGLILLTNDGELANRLQHPRYGVEKEYLVEVDGSLSRPAVAKLRKGIVLEDGPARAIRVGPVQRAGLRSAVTVVMGEGRKREVRRMLESVGFPVRRLVRVRQGPVRLGQLRAGEVRPLTQEEVTELYRLTGMMEARVGGPPGGYGQQGGEQADLASRSRVRRSGQSDNST